MSTHAAAQNRVLLRRRPDQARVWWRGMWELPRVTARDDESGEEALSRLLREELGCKPSDFQIGPLLKTVKHGVTHHQITLGCRQVSLCSALSETSHTFQHSETPSSGAAWHWFSWEETRALAMPSSMRRLLNWLETHPRPEQGSLFIDS